MMGLGFGGIEKKKQQEKILTLQCLQRLNWSLLV